MIAEQPFKESYNYGQYEATVAEIISNVREKRMKRYLNIQKFDKCRINASNIKVTREEIEKLIPRSIEAD